MVKRVLCASVASAAMTLAAPATYAVAEDVGCCRVECRGPNTVDVTLHDTIASECQPSSQECSATWSAEACPKGHRGAWRAWRRRIRDSARISSGSALTAAAAASAL